MQKEILPLVPIKSRVPILQPRLTRTENEREQLNKFFTNPDNLDNHQHLAHHFPEYYTPGETESARHRVYKERKQKI